jgi:peptide/nickel transport system substrate-binding protein
MRTLLARPFRLFAALLLAATTLCAPATGTAQDLKGGRLRVAVLADINGFDPQSFLTVNFPIIKNFYDSLIEYTPDGKAVPSLASAWKIAPDNTSVTLTLRKDVKFHSGAPFNAAAVAATLKKAADPKQGKNVYATMSFVRDWTIVDDATITLNFTGPAPERQITDLLQFISVIDPAGIDTVDTKPAGTGAYVLAERAVGQRIRMTANPAYWRAKEPVSSEVVLTIFSEDAAATAALESGAVDLIYGGSARSAVRLRGAGNQLIQGPGPLVQVFRINTTRGPFRNEKFRQAFNFLLDREGILRVGYAGLGKVTALPWAPASPAVDASYDARYAFDTEKARALLAASGLSAAEMNNWKLLVNGGDESLVLISQVAQSSLAKAGIKVDLDLKQGAEFVDALLNGKFDAVFGAIGNVQKFPTRLTTNSIYRTTNNPILGTPHPHPAYVAAIDRVNKTFGPGADVRGAYDNLNRVLVDSAFGIPTNTYDTGLIVAAPAVGGFTLDIDNMLVARTIGFKR